MTEFRDHEGRVMVPLCCQSCGLQIGVRSPGPEPDPELVDAKCFSCAATEEAERITEEAA